jgi:uncharacterized protein (DUF2164 family)
MKYVLAASAVIALLTDELGAVFIKQLLRDSDNQCSAAYRRNGNDATPEFKIRFIR